MKWLFVTSPFYVPKWYTLSQKETKIMTQREILLKDTLEKLEKCKHIKREGESCRLNNNCTYPDCEIENLHRSVQSVK